MFRRKNNNFNSKTTDELKRLTQILIIDDHDNSLKKMLENENWTANYAKDLDNYSNQYLEKAHIVCLDIHGVGKKLKCADGLELAGYIKEKYPSKRILLYSSEPNHDIFNKNIDIVDKRIYKDGQPYPFIKAIEELSMKIFDWKAVLEDIFQKHKNEFGSELTFEKFEKEMKKIANKDKFNKEDVSKVLSASLEIATRIIILTQAFMAK